ncbi:MAG: PAS domain S-box protein [Ignavibacteriales bacterium]|nr:PAS domain S-box protein [Ignavibacteriales bacterium]
MSAESGRRSALRIALVYASFGAAWIFLSDTALGWLSRDPALITQIAMYKGWLYVLITASLLYSLLRVEFHIRRSAEEATRLSETKFRHIAQATSAAMIIFDNQQLLFANEGAERLTGYTREELLAKPLGSLLLPEHKPAAKNILTQLRTGGPAVHLEMEIRSKQGDVRWIDASVIAFEQGGRQTFLGTVFDVSQRKNSEQMIRLSLREKEVLLKEIHHRVKNNMQVISSLLHLQSDYAKDNYHKVLFDESQGRVKSMALIHEKLYQSENLASIDFLEYIRDLTDSLQRSTYGRQVTVSITGDDCRLGIDDAIPCGLIIHELFSNSLKHAFPVQEHGLIEISMQRLNDGWILTVRDNGVGIPDTIDPFNTKTLGLQLVITLAQQLGGKPSFKTGPGTTFSLEFAPVQQFSSAPDGILKG